MKHFLIMQVYQFLLVVIALSALIYTFTGFQIFYILGFIKLTTTAITKSTVVTFILAKLVVFLIFFYFGILLIYISKKKLFINSTLLGVFIFIFGMMPVLDLIVLALFFNIEYSRSVNFETVSFIIGPIYFAAILGIMIFSFLLPKETELQKKARKRFIFGIILLTILTPASSLLIDIVLYELLIGAFSNNSLGRSYDPFTIVISSVNLLLYSFFLILTIRGVETVYNEGV